MLSSILGILILVGVAMTGVWLFETYRVLVRFRTRVQVAWDALKVELRNRQDLIPYLVGSAGGSEGQLVEAIGNACDLAARGSGVLDQARAEARLSAAVRRLLEELDSESAANSAPESIERLRAELAATDRKVDVLSDFYNREAGNYNRCRQSTRHSRWVAAVAHMGAAELFDPGGGMAGESEPALQARRSAP